MASKLAELRGELDATRAAAKELFDKYPDPGDMNDEARSSAKQFNAKMADLNEKVSEIQELEAIRERAAAKPTSAGVAVGVERPTTDPDANKAWDFERELRANSSYMDLVHSKAQVDGKKGFSLPLVEIPSFKTLMTLTTLNNPATRRPGIVPFAQDTTTVGDLMLPGTTDNNTITYIEETTFTNAAATVAEGAAKPESALAFTERTDNVRKIATWIPVTDELLADVAGFRSYLEGRLRFMVEREEEDQLLNGDGTAPNISGILDRTGIQTVGSAGTDLDAIYAGILEVQRDGFAEPTGIVMHPTDYAAVRLAKDSTGTYLGNSPWDVDNTPRLWGIQVRVTPLIAAGTALVGAFRPYAQVFRREGITVTASTEHASFFIENKVAVLAEERLALAVYRAAAFCTVTGLGA